MFLCKNAENIIICDIAADRETVKQEVKTDLNFLLINGTERRLKQNINVDVSNNYITH